MTLEGKKIKLSIVWTHKGDEQTTNDNAKLKMIMPRHEREAVRVNKSTNNVSSTLTMRHTFTYG